MSVARLPQIHKMPIDGLKFGRFSRDQPKFHTSSSKEVNQTINFCQTSLWENFWAAGAAAIEASTVSLVIQKMKKSHWEHRQEDIQGNS